jgi:hypothetical protein
MAQAIHFLVHWFMAFLTLCAALGVLNLFYRVIGSDLGLATLGKEALVAGFASLWEGAALWLAFSVLHG